MDTAEALTTLDGLVCLAIEYLPSSVVIASNVILPALFTKLIVYERYFVSQTKFRKYIFFIFRYNTDTELVVNLTRCIFLRLASLAIAFYTVYFTVRCDYKQVIRKCAY